MGARCCSPLRTALDLGDTGGGGGWRLKDEGFRVWGLGLGWPGPKGL